MTLTDKIKQILTDKNYTPSIFADTIGVQRSSISHILAGRNKPSLDIVQKIVKRFPELGVQWILDDVDLPEIEEATPEPKTAQPAEATRIIPPTPAPMPEEPAKSPEVKPAAPARKVDKIILLYNDGTFEEFKQN